MVQMDNRAAQHLDPVIASSNRFRDIGSYSTIIYHQDPSKWGAIVPWEFPQAASREAEEAFLRQWFDERDIRMQGGAHGAGAGFRFLKQVWYTIAIWNVDERIPAIAQWWWTKESNREIVADNAMLNHICDPNAKPETFFDANEINLFGHKILALVIFHIQNKARHAKTDAASRPQLERLHVPKSRQAYHLPPVDPSDTREQDDLDHSQAHHKSKNPPQKACDTSLIQTGTRVGKITNGEHQLAAGQHIGLTLSQAPKVASSPLTTHGLSSTGIGAQRAPSAPPYISQPADQTSDNSLRSTSTHLHAQDRRPHLEVYTGPWQASDSAMTPKTHHTDCLQCVPMTFEHQHSHNRERHEGLPHRVPPDSAYHLSSTHYTPFNGPMFSQARQMLGGVEPQDRGSVRGKGRGRGKHKSREHSAGITVGDAHLFHPNGLGHTARYSSFYHPRPQFESIPGGGVVAHTVPHPFMIEEHHPQAQSVLSTPMPPRTHNNLVHTTTSNFHQDLSSNRCASLVDLTNMNAHHAIQSFNDQSVGKFFIAPNRFDVVQLVVFGDHESASRQMIEDLFASVQIYSTQIRLTNNRKPINRVKSVPVATVVCKNHEDARRALSLNGHPFRGQNVRVEVSRKYWDSNWKYQSQHLHRDDTLPMSRAASGQGSLPRVGRHDGSWTPMLPLATMAGDQYISTTALATMMQPSISHPTVREAFSQSTEAACYSLAHNVSRSSADGSHQITSDNTPHTKNKKRKLTKNKHERKSTPSHRITNSDSVENHPVPQTSHASVEPDLTKHSMQEKSRCSSHVHQLSHHTVEHPEQTEQTEQLSQRSHSSKDVVASSDRLHTNDDDAGEPPFASSREASGQIVSPSHDRLPDVLPSISLLHDPGPRNDTQEHNQSIHEARAELPSEIETAERACHGKTANVGDGDKNVNGLDADDRGDRTLLPGEDNLPSVTNFPDNALGSTGNQDGELVTQQPQAGTTADTSRTETDNSGKAQQSPLPSSSPVEIAIVLPNKRLVDHPIKREKQKGPSHTESFSMFGRRAEKSKKKDNKAREIVKGKSKEKIQSSRVVSAPVASVTSHHAAERRSQNGELAAKAGDKERAQTLHTVDERANDRVEHDKTTDSSKDKRKGGSLSTLFGLFGTTTPQSPVTSAQVPPDVNLLTSVTATDNADSCQTPNIEDKVVNTVQSPPTDMTASILPQMTVETAGLVLCGLGLADTSLLSSKNERPLTTCERERGELLSHISNDNYDGMLGRCSDPPGNTSSPHFTHNEALASASRYEIDIDDRTDSSHTLSNWSDDGSRHKVSSSARKLAEKHPLGEKKHLIEAPEPRNARKRRVQNASKQKAEESGANDPLTVVGGSWLAELISQTRSAQTRFTECSPNDVQKQNEITSLITRGSTEEGNGSGSHAPESTGLLVVLRAIDATKPAVADDGDQYPRDQDRQYEYTLRSLLPRSSPVLAASSPHTIGEIEELDDGLDGG